MSISSSSNNNNDYLNEYVKEEECSSSTPNSKGSNAPAPGIERGFLSSLIILVGPLAVHLHMTYTQKVNFI